MVEWAKLLGHGKIADLLKQNLDEESAADTKLNSLATTRLNAAAKAA